jgi:hypothetical protein
VVITMSLAGLVFAVPPARTDVRRWARRQAWAPALRHWHALANRKDRSLLVMFDDATP